MYRSQLPFSRFKRRPSGERFRSPIFGFVTSLMAALIVLALVLPHPIVLPALSLCSLAAAACAAVVAALPLRSRPSYATAAWDMAGAFTLVCCAAAILGEIEPLVETFRPPAPRSRTND
jgi:hypothetical protein